MTRNLNHLFALIFIGVVVVLAVAHHSFLFVTPWHENGDFAVNALQIERAKHLHELYGNYSRFHFNHPGPVFFYVYALGEIVLYDFFGFVPAPHSAHSLAGLLLQAAFFAGALKIAHGWLRSPWFIPLSLVAAAVHFSLAREAFVSIWPPHVLVMPFLCFLVACASTAAGRINHLPFAALAGCFLVHGYVAQPLYVVTLFTLSYWMCWRKTRQPGEPWKAVLTRHRLPHIAAIACIGLFLLPILIDFTFGSASNFSRILDFLGGHKNEHQTLWRSVLYLISFFCYLHSQDHYLPETGATDTSFLSAHLPSLAIWAFILIVVGFYVNRVSQRSKDTPEAPFILSLALLIGVALFLSLGWGIIQVGPMFEFNGQFYYGMLFALLLAFAAASAHILPSRGARIGGVLLCIAAVAITWKMRRPPISTQDMNYGMIAATAAALEADPRPSAPKLLVFEHDDWGEVASAALALKRAGKSYRVDGNWAFMFGHYRTFRPSPPHFQLDNLSVWRVIRNGPVDGGLPLTKNLRVYFRPATLDPAATTINCVRGATLNQFALFGFTAPDETASWTNMPEAGLQFRSKPAAHDVEFTITATPFAPQSRQIYNQPMQLFVNGRKIQSFDLKERETVSAHIPREIWNLQQDVSVVLHFPGAVSPASLGLSADPRILGWLVEKMTFAYTK